MSYLESTVVVDGTSYLVTEEWGSRASVEGPDPRATLQFIVRGGDDPLEAKVALLYGSPLVWDGLLRRERDTTRIAHRTHLGVVRYGRLPPGPDDPDWVSDGYHVDFTTAGGTQRVRQAIATVASYAPAGKVAPDVAGVIGRGEGVDVVVPVFEWTETHHLADVTALYKSYLYSLTGTVNHAAWGVYSAGEVLFQGVTGRRAGPDGWTLTYRFAASPNMTDIAVGPITVTAKEGWDYLDILYEDVVDENELVQNPRAAYVQQVYRRGDFALLGL